MPCSSYVFGHYTSSVFLFGKQIGVRSNVNLFDKDFVGCDLSCVLRVNGFVWMQVAVDIDYHHNMLASHLKVNPKEVIVGWYFSFSLIFP